MWSVTVLLAAFETTDVAVLRSPNGRPRMLLLILLDVLVSVLLLELLFEPKSELRMLLRVVVEEDVEDVVRASPALAVGSVAAIQAKIVSSSVANRSGLEVCGNDGR
jgi:hypothetical protein